MDLSGDQRYYDLGKERRESTDFFFLESVLRARIDLKLPTGKHDDNDEDTNVYMAGLLTSALSSGATFNAKPYLSPYDVDVQHYLEQHPGASNEYVVYRENADFGLVSTSVFLGYEHKGSYHDRVLGFVDDSGRVALYYKMAANALEHIRGRRMILVHTFETMADNMDEVVQIMRKVSGDYFHFIGRLSEGTFFHLEREVEVMARYAQYQRTLDEFLEQYGEFQRNPTQDGSDRIRRLVKVLRGLNPGFAFDESKLVVESRPQQQEIPEQGGGGQ